MRPCKDCNKAHEMVLASMEYVKVLGFRIRKTEEISETWKKAAQTHAEECVKLREQLHHLRTAAESGMLPQIVKERDALRAELDTERERHKQTASILAQYAPKTMQIEPPPEATHDTPAGKEVAESVIRDCRNTEPDDEFKVGDVVEVISSLGPHTYTTDIGARGIVEEISKGGEYIDLEPVNGFRAAYGCRVSLRDVRKVTPVVKSCIEIVEDAK